MYGERSELAIKKKIRLMKIMNGQKPIMYAFRSWKLCKYPFLPQNTTHFKVKRVNKLVKLRYVMIGFQKDRKNSDYNRCNVSIIVKFKT